MSARCMCSGVCVRMCMRVHVCVYALPGSLRLRCNGGPGRSYS